MFAIVTCSVLCVLMVEGMSVVMDVMLSLMSVMSPPPALPCAVGAVVTVTVMYALLFVMHVCMLRECEGLRVTAMLVWGLGEV